MSINPNTWVIFGNSIYLLTYKCDVFMSLALFNLKKSDKNIRNHILLYHLFLNFIIDHLKFMYRI